MKIFSLAFVITLSNLLFWGCTPSSNTGSGANLPNNNIYDPNYFFTVTFKGKTLTCYELRDRYHPSYGQFKCGLTVGPDGNGNTMYGFNFSMFHMIFDTSYYSGQLPPMRILSGSASRKNSYLGIYNESATVQGPNLGFDDFTELIPRSYFTDIRHPYPDGCSYNITSISDSVVTGTFNFVMLDIDGVTSFPASGSFRFKRG
jgi:hypothetical protein